MPDRRLHHIVYRMFAQNCQQTNAEEYSTKRMYDVHSWSSRCLPLRESQLSPCDSWMNMMNVSCVTIVFGPSDCFNYKITNRTEIYICVVIFVNAVASGVSRGEIWLWCSTCVICGLLLECLGMSAVYSLFCVRADSNVDSFGNRKFENLVESFSKRALTDILPRAFTWALEGFYKTLVKARVWTRQKYSKIQPLIHLNKQTLEALLF